jgi:hypothetical protein
MYCRPSPAWYAGSSKAPQGARQSPLTHPTAAVKAALYISVPPCTAHMKHGGIDCCAGHCRYCMPRRQEWLTRRAACAPCDAGCAARAACNRSLVPSALCTSPNGASMPPAACLYSRLQERAAPAPHSLAACVVGGMLGTWGRFRWQHFKGWHAPISTHLCLPARRRPAAGNKRCRQGPLVVSCQRYIPVLPCCPAAVMVACFRWGAALLAASRHFLLPPALPKNLRIRGVHGAATQRKQINSCCRAHQSIVATCYGLPAALRQLSGCTQPAGSTARRKPNQGGARNPRLFIPHLLRTPGWRPQPPVQTVAAGIVPQPQGNSHSMTEPTLLCTGAFEAPQSTVPTVLVHWRRVRYPDSSDIRAGSCQAEFLARHDVQNTTPLRCRLTPARGAVLRRRGQQQAMRCVWPPLSAQWYSLVLSVSQWYSVVLRLQQEQLCQGCARARVRTRVPASSGPPLCCPSPQLPGSYGWHHAGLGPHFRSPPGSTHTGPCSTHGPCLYSPTRLLASTSPALQQQRSAASHSPGTACTCTALRAKNVHSHGTDSTTCGECHQLTTKLAGCLTDTAASPPPLPPLPALHRLRSAGGIHRTHRPPAAPTPWSSSARCCSTSCRWLLSIGTAGAAVLLGAAGSAPWRCTVQGMQLHGMHHATAYTTCYASWCCMHYRLRVKIVRATV